MVYNPTLKCIVSGCEDGNIRIFSHGVTKITRKIEGGSAVSSVTTRKEWQIVAGMHDGSMGVWDIRNYKKILAVPHAHHTKYDEGVFDVHCDGDSILTAGADGIIKVYS
jgi:WD40 repeat protein